MYKAQSLQEVCGSLQAQTLTSSLDGNSQVCRLLAVAVVSSHGLFASAPFSVMRQSGLMASPTQWT